MALALARKSRTVTTASCPIGSGGAGIVTGLSSERPNQAWTRAAAAPRGQRRAIDSVGL